MVPLRSFSLVVFTILIIIVVDASLESSALGNRPVSPNSFINFFSSFRHPHSDAAAQSRAEVRRIAAAVINASTPWASERNQESKGMHFSSMNNNSEFNETLNRIRTDSHNRMLIMSELHLSRFRSTEGVETQSNVALRVDYIACPAGNYCDGTPGVGSQSCPMGRWNNMSAQTACFECPIGFQCPSRTMHTPQLCNPGYVCQNLSTQAPTILCPAGYYCLQGTATQDPQDPLWPNRRPLPCDPGTYCLPGVMSRTVNDNLNGFPHSCNEGYWCTLASPTPSGAGRCNPGFYCPKGSALPTPTNPGFYTGQPGAMVAIMCAPGSYAALMQLAKCTDCPAGFKCPNFGMSVPIVCPRGSYRAQSDAISCRPCPMGTWSPGRGVTDLNLCQPCPPGRVCGQTGMITLASTSACLPGYYCPPGTSPSTQFSNRCPAGYGCDASIGPDQIYTYICPRGFVCNSGTPASLMTRAGCPARFYCPSGTYGALDQNLTKITGVETSLSIDQELVNQVVCGSKPGESTVTSACPTGKASPFPLLIIIKPAGPGKPVSDSIEIQMDTVTRKPIYVVDDNGDKQTVQLTGVWNQTWSMPNGQKEQHVPNFCMRGTNSNSKSTSIKECFATKNPNSNQFDSLTWYSPINVQKTLQSGLELSPNINGYSRSDLWVMDPFFLYSIDCDWSSIDSSWIYATPPDLGINSQSTLFGHFNLTFTSGASQNLSQPLLPSPNDVNRVPYNFEHATVPKFNTWNFKIVPLVQLKLTLMINILHGTYLMKAWDFVDTCSINVTMPTRANVGTNNMFMVVSPFDDKSPTDGPMNLPRLKMMSGSSQNSYLVGFGPTNMSVPLVNVPTSQTYVSKSDRTSVPGAGVYVLPYLPFFSNCRGYGSHIPLYDIFENPKYCNLVPVEDTIVVSQTDFFKSARSDTCSSQLMCKFEEDIAKPATNGIRWYAITGKVDLFYLSTWPVDYSIVNYTAKPDDSFVDFQGVLGQLVELFDTSFKGIDVVPVVSTRDTSGIAGLPRTVKLSVYYHQFTPTLKKLIHAKLLLTDFDTNLGSLDYKLKWELISMPWTDLFNDFAFPAALYTMAFFIIAGVQLGMFALLYLLFRACSGSKFGPMNYIKFQRILLPGPLLAFAFVGFPVLVFLLIIYEITVVRNVFYYTSCNFSVDSCDADGTLGSRIGQIFMSLGAFLIFTGSHLINPTQVFLKKGKAQMRRELAEDDPANRIKIEKSIEEDMKSDTEEFTPRYWKRVAYSFFCVCLAICLEFPLNFAYSEYFQLNVMPMVLFAKLLQPFLEKMFLSVVGEYLMLAPLIAALNWIQAMICFGAGSFSTFITCYLALMFLGTMQRLFYGPYITINWDYWALQIEKLFINIGARDPEMNALDARQELELLRQRDPNLIARPAHELMEPIIEAMTIIAGETTGQMVMPISIYILQQFVVSTNITRTFNVADSSIQFYLIFSLVMFAANRLTDIVVLNLMEASFGWKVWDFFNYMQYCFTMRHRKWKGDEVDPASNLPKSMRSTEKMCFSSQYYIMIFFPAVGIVIFLIGFETMLQNQVILEVPIMADALAPVLLCGTFFVCYLGRLVLTYIGYGARWGLRLYKLPERSSAQRLFKRHIDIPNWLRFAELEKHYGSVDQYNEVATARLTDEQFRQQFIDQTQNRQFISTHLDKLITPRAASGLGTAFVTQLASIIRQSNAAPAISADGQIIGANTALGQISDSDHSDQHEEADTAQWSARATARGQQTARLAAKKSKKERIARKEALEAAKYRPVVLTATHSRLARVWLHLARRRMQLTAWAEDFSRQSASGECGQCEKPMLQSHMLPYFRVPLRDLIDMFESSDDGHAVTSTLDHEMWINFLSDRPIIQLLCPPCFARQRQNVLSSAQISQIMGTSDSSMGAALGRLKVKPLTECDRKLLLLWFSQARNRLSGGRAQVVSRAPTAPLPPTITLRADISSDDSDTPAAPAARAAAAASKRGDTRKLPLSTLLPDSGDEQVSDTFDSDLDDIDVVPSSRSEPTPSGRHRRERLGLGRPSHVAALDLPFESKEAERFRALSVLTRMEVAKASAAAAEEALKTRGWKIMDAVGADAEAARAAELRKNGVRPDDVAARRMANTVTVDGQAATDVIARVVETNADPMTAVKMRPKARNELDFTVKQISTAVSALQQKQVLRFVMQLSATFQPLGAADFQLTLSGRERRIGYVAPPDVKMLLAHWLVNSRKARGVATDVQVDENALLAQFQRDTLEADE